MKKRSMGDRIFDAIVYAILVVVFLIVFFPLMYVVSTSFASARELALNKFLIFPKHPTLEVYQYIFSTNISTKSEPEIEKNGTPASPAMALASKVLPVPGEPTSRMPRGIWPPKR